MTASLELGLDEKRRQKMLVVLEGSVGSGKTLSAVALAIMEKEKSGKEIVSNIHLNTEYRLISSDDFVKLMMDNSLKNCSIILDSMYIIADSRGSQSSLNKLFSYFVAGSRKNEIDIYLVANNFSDIDIRLRKATDIRGKCKYDIKTKICSISFVDLQSKDAERKTIRIDLSKFFDMVSGTKSISCSESNLDRIVENVENYEMVKKL